MAQLAQAALARAAQDQLVKAEIKSELPEEKPMPQLTPAPAHIMSQMDIKTEPEKTFHPVNSSRGEQTTTPSFGSNFGSMESSPKFSPVESTPLDLPTNQGNYAHMMSQYIPDSMNQMAQSVPQLAQMPVQRNPQPTQPPIPPTQASITPTQASITPTQNAFDPQNPLDGLDRLVEHQVINYLHERTRNESVGKCF